MAGFGMARGLLFPRTEPRIDRSGRRLERLRRYVTKQNHEEGTTMNNITRYRPLNSVFAVPRDLGRLMDDVFGGGWDTGENLRQWLPATDVSETPESVTLRLEVPGLTRDQIKIAVENNV